MNTTKRSGKFAGSSRADEAYASWENSSVILLQTWEVAVVLRCSDHHVTDLIREGLLQALPKEAGKWKIFKSSVQTLFERAGVKR